jgi:anti-sigma regulatory factor (Ser/Thr protein kinase)
LEVIVMYVTPHDSPACVDGSFSADRRPVQEAVDGGRAPARTHRGSADDHNHPLWVSETLEHRVEAVATARHTAQTVLEDWDLDEETADAVLLVISELVTNAVEHAEPPLALHLHREHTGNRLWIGVTDGGPATHDGPWTTTCADDEHGRGLHIIDALADSQGTTSHPHGITHWARLTTN